MDDMSTVCYAMLRISHMSLEAGGTRVQSKSRKGESHKGEYRIRGKTSTLPIIYYIKNIAQGGNKPKNIA